MNDDLLLSLLWAVPLGGGLAVLLVPARATAAIRGFALGTTVVTFLLALGALASYRSGGLVTAPLAARAAANAADSSAHPGGDLVVRHPWIAEFRIEYYLGLDGISLALVLLTTLIGVLACLASWGIESKVKGYFSLYLILMASMVGVFLALDLVLFYVFFEVMLLPMYFLIALWGGERREYAALKFLLYTLFGSVFILVAILVLFFWTGDAPSPGFQAGTFDMARLATAATTGYYGPRVQGWVFLLFFVGFAVKLPSFPFHTWLPDAHVEAPTPISMILAGVLLKVGGYGLIRLAWPLAPAGAAAWAYPVAALGAFGIIYGALAALAQADFKRLVAYSSVSHMGYVTLGMAALAGAGRDPAAAAFGPSGAMFMMIAHGITASGLFFVVGMVYERTRTRDLDSLGGLGGPMPGLFGVALVLFFGALGLPGLCGFVAEVFVVLAAFGYDPVLGGVAAFAVVLTAGYMLGAFRRVFQGPSREGMGRSLPDLSPREWLIAAPLVVLTVALGVWPRLMLDWVGPSVADQAGRAVAARPAVGPPPPRISP